MTVRSVVSPALPLAPNQYDPVYFNQLVKTLQLYFRRLDQSLSGVSLVFAMVPNSGFGLPVGAVFAFAGALRVVQLGEAYPNGNALTAAVGQVSVTT